MLMQPNGVTVRWGEILAGLVWLGVLVLAVADGGDGRVGILGLWALLLASVASAMSLASWRSRRDQREYDRGLDDGLATANIIKISDHERV